MMTCYLTDEFFRIILTFPEISPAALGAGWDKDGSFSSLNLRMIPDRGISFRGVWQRGDEIPSCRSSQINLFFEYPQDYYQACHEPLVHR
jgi:hypothetical protein